MCACVITNKKQDTFKTSDEQNNIFCFSFLIKLICIDYYLCKKTGCDWAYLF